VSPRSTSRTRRRPSAAATSPGRRSSPQEQARSRFEAAVDAKQSEDTVIIARIDSYGSANGDWEDHLERGRIYADAGVDLVWPEMPDPSREDAIEYAETIHETHPDLDLAFNYSLLVRVGAQEDPLTFEEELGDLGYQYIFITLYGLHSGAHAAYEDFANIAENDEEAQFDLEERYIGHETESHHELSFRPAVPGHRGPVRPRRQPAPRGVGRLHRRGERPDHHREQRRRLIASTDNSHASTDDRPPIAVPGRHRFGIAPRFSAR